MEKRELFNWKRCIYLLLAALLPALGGYAQKMTVKGVVVDATNEPIIGANVVEKGTTNGIITDLDGNFTATSRCRSSEVLRSFSPSSAISLKNFRPPHSPCA